MIFSILAYRYLDYLKIEKDKFLSLFIFLSPLLFFFSYGYFDYQILSILSILAVIDYKLKIIPNELVVILLLLSLCNYGQRVQFSFEIIYSFITLSILLIISLLNGSVGMGDIKLFTVILMIKGGEFFIRLIFIMSLELFIFAIFLLFNKKKLKDTIPLVPIIFLAYILILEVK